MGGDLDHRHPIQAAKGGRCHVSSTQVSTLPTNSTQSRLTSERKSFQLPTARSSWSTWRRWRPWAARSRLGHFPTRSGRRRAVAPVGGRLLAGAAERANAERAEEGKQLLPERVTPHTRRRTFASLALET